MCPGKVTLPTEQVNRGHISLVSHWLTQGLVRAGYTIDLISVLKKAKQNNQQLCEEYTGGVQKQTQEIPGAAEGRCGGDLRLS